MALSAFLAGVGRGGKALQEPTRRPIRSGGVIVGLVLKEDPRAISRARISRVAFRRRTRTIVSVLVEALRVIKADLRRRPGVSLRCSEDPTRADLVARKARVSVSDLCSVSGSHAGVNPTV